jgi:hypothetical protein
MTSEPAASQGYGFVSRLWCTAKGAQPLPAAMTSRDGSVGTVAGYGMNGRQGQDFFCVPQRPDGHWGPASFLYSRYLGIFPVGKATVGLKLEVKKAWSYTSTPSYVSGKPLAVGCD